MEGVFLLADVTDCHQNCQQIYWLSPNLSGRFTDIYTKSASRLTECHQICWAEMLGAVFLLADLLSLTKSAGRFTVTKSASRFADFQQFWQQKWREISARKYMDCHQICQQIYWLSVNLLADLLNLTKSADRNVGVSISAGRLTDSQ